jgi:DNA-binding response OmpR family regulator
MEWTGKVLCTWRQPSYDVAVIDIMLPKLDGLSLIEQPDSGR